MQQIAPKKMPPAMPFGKADGLKRTAEAEPRGRLPRGSGVRSVIIVGSGLAPRPLRGGQAAGLFPFPGGQITVLPSTKPAIIPSTSYREANDAIRVSGEAMENLFSSKYFLRAEKNFSSPIAPRSVSNIMSALL